MLHLQYSLQGRQEEYHEEMARVASVHCMPAVVTLGMWFQKAVVFSLPASQSLKFILNIEYNVILQVVEL